MKRLSLVDLAETIKNNRTEKGITQEQLCEKRSYRLLLRWGSLFLVLCNLSRRRRSGFYPCRGSVGDHDQEHDDGYDHQDFLDGTTFDPADEFCKHRIFLPDCVTLWLKLFTFVKITIKSVSR